MNYKEYFNIILEHKFFLAEDVIIRMALSPCSNAKNLIIEYFGSKLHPSRYTNCSTYCFKERASKIFEKLGISNSRGRAYLAELVKDGILHRCGDIGDRNRQWKLGKKEDCICSKVKVKCKDSHYLDVNSAEINLANISRSEFYKEVSSYFSFTDDIVGNYIGVLQVMGIDYTSKHDDYFMFEKVCNENNIDVDIFTAKYICLYIYDKVLPEINNGKIKIKSTYISNMPEDILVSKALELIKE